VAGQSYRFAVCRADGTVINEASGARTRRLTMLLNGVHSATVALPLTDATALGFTPGTGRLKVYRSPSDAQKAANPGVSPALLFYGQLPATNVQLDTGGSEDTDGLATAVYQDPRWRFAFMDTLGTEGPYSTDQGAILWALVAVQNARTGGDTYLLQGSTTTGKIRDRDYRLAGATGLVGEGIGQIILQTAFDEMVALDGGCDYDVTPVDGSVLAAPTMQMGTLNVYARQGSLRPNATFTLGADIKSNVQQITLSYAPLVTYSTHTGIDMPGQRIAASFGTPSAAAGQYGLIEQLQNDQSVSDLATLTAKSIADITLMSQLRPIVTISNPLPDAPAVFEDYFIGDTIYVSCRKGSLVLANLPLRVHGIDLTIDDVGHENVTLTTSPQ
jgi:hypothetical protein